MLERILNAKRSTKRLISLTYDAVTIPVALYACMALRLGELNIALSPAILGCFGATLTLSLAIYIRLGLYRAILRYAPLEALQTVAIGAFLSSFILTCSSFFTHANLPRSSPIIYFLCTLLLLGSPRLIIRSLVNFQVNGLKRTQIKNQESVVIYGAGYSGYQLALSLEYNPNYRVSAFIDDNPKLHGNRLRSATIHPPSELGKLIAKHKITSALLAVSSATRDQRSQMVSRVEDCGLKALTIPPINDILSGKSRIEDLKAVEIEDLLGRDPVQPDQKLMQANIENKVVMVTGAGGSIGSELCRQILAQKPKTLLLFELNEYNLYKIEQELQNQIEDENQDVKLFALLGSVQNQQRLEAVMQSFQVQTVYHAAAYKHVPLVEHNMIEGLQNNVFGTYRCAQAASTSNSVETFVLISTDKAVRSTNIMGASKRLAEMVIQLVATNDSKTRFSTVRFGNVLGSSGSVVPKFRKQIEMGGPVTVTHPDVTRYFMTIPEAAQLVIQAGAMAKGGETYVLEMGEPVKIADLAKEMIRLSGYTLKNDQNPQGHIDIQYTGLRPGEKLFEELLIIDNVVGTKHSRITEALEEDLDHTKVKATLSKLIELCNNMKYEDTIKLLTSLPNTYTGTLPPKDNLIRIKQEEPHKLTVIK